MPQPKKRDLNQTNHNNGAKKTKTIHYLSSVTIEQSSGANEHSFFNPSPKLPEVAKAAPTPETVKKMVENFLEQFKSHAWFSKIPLALQPVVFNRAVVMFRKKYAPIKENEEISPQFFVNFINGLLSNKDFYRAVINFIFFDQDQFLIKDKIGLLQFGVAIHSNIEELVPKNLLKEFITFSLDEVRKSHDNNNNIILLDEMINKINLLEHWYNFRIMMETIPLGTIEDRNDFDTTYQALRNIYRKGFFAICPNAIPVNDDLTAVQSELKNICAQKRLQNNSPVEEVFEPLVMDEDLSNLLIFFAVSKMFNEEELKLISDCIEKPAMYLRK